MRELGSFLRKEREKRQLLLREAAAKLDMDSAVLSKIERGERKANKEQVSSFASLYSLDLRELLILWNTHRVIELIQREENQKEILSSALENF